jgi:hypothetical protein
MHWYSIAAIGFASGAVGGVVGTALLAYCVEKLIDWH